MTGDHRTPLDDAHLARAEGRTEDALRCAAAVVAATPEHAPAAALLLELLVDAGRTRHVAAAAPRLVDAFVRRGDLPRALSATLVAEQAGVDPAPLRRAIAEAFGRGSKRIADVAPSPPPLPAEVDPSDASGDPLLDQAEAALAVFSRAKDSVPEDRPLPRLPLFGALPPKPLAALLAAWERRELGVGDAAIEEGTEGRDAFVAVRGLLRAQRGVGDEAIVLADLGPGALFGEMALVSEAPRAASVVAREPSVVLAASREALEKLAKKVPAIGTELSSFCQARMVDNLVRHSAILRPLAIEERAALMQRFEAKRFRVGEALVREGEEAGGLFLIASGAVKVVGRDDDGDALEVAELGPGDVVGEIGLVLRRPASADVLATHQTVALELPYEAFQAAIKEHPTLLGELYDLATKREEELRSVVAQEALDVEEMVLL